MANYKINFCCPKCGIKLSIAVEQAGSSGPCPSCSEVIQSPAVQQEMLFGEDSPESAEEPAVSQTYPKVIGRLAKDEKISAQQMIDALHAPSISESANTIAPEYVKLAPNARKSKSRRALYRILGGVAMGLVTLLLLLQLMQFLKSPTTDGKAMTSNDRQQRDPMAPVAVGEQEFVEANPAVDELQLPVVEIESDTQPVLVLPQHGFLEFTPQQVLAKFLSSVSLEERLPLMMTKTPEEDLMVSCLSSGLLPVKSIKLDFKETLPDSNSVNHYFAVGFENGEQVDDHLILVRVVGEQGPRVVADPFLDVYGGRLQQFASGPAAGLIDVEVMVSPLAACSDETIPNPTQKRTLQLMGAEYGEVLANAHFGRSSEIEKLLKDGTYRLSYGNPVPAVVTLRWNRTENATTPFLEAVEIKGFQWGR